MTDSSQTTPEPEEERSGTYLGREPSSDPLVRSTARTVKRIGYPILCAVILWLTIPILYGVVHGVWVGQVWDPQSKRPISIHESREDCHAWGSKLLAEHGTSAFTPEEAQKWSAACGALEPEWRALLESPPR